MADGDGCERDCRLGALTQPHCGDQALDPGEECDFGASNSNVLPDSCRTNCRTAFCGDGVVDSGEACDDGNADEWDGCTWNCLVNVCGNGILEGTEECDAGNLNSDTQPNSCRTVCRTPRCGDGVTDVGEECDDANRVGDDGCTNSCVIACPAGSQKIDGRCLLVTHEAGDECGIFCKAGNAWESWMDRLFGLFE